MIIEEVPQSPETKTTSVPNNLSDGGKLTFSTIFAGNVKGNIYLSLKTVADCRHSCRVYAQLSVSYHGFFQNKMIFISLLGLVVF